MAEIIWADEDVSLAALAAEVEPPEEVALRYRRHGWWRDRTVVHDLHRYAAEAPDRPAIISHRAHRPEGCRITRISYAQLAVYVERFAAGLAALGLTAGDPVAYQLPNWWETAALHLACLRLGALAVPVLPTVRPHDLEALLDTTQARVCVVPDVWDGFPHAETLADIAPRLPWLRHRVVIGDAAATRSLDFERWFTATAHERHPDAARMLTRPGAADRPCVLVNLLGLGDSHTGILHTPNSLYASASTHTGVHAAPALPGDVFHSPLPLTSLAATIYGVWWPLLVGGTSVFQDVWNPGTALDLFEQTGVGQVFAAPTYVSELVTAQRRTPRDLGALRLVLTGGMGTNPARLAEQVPRALGVPLRTFWGSPQVSIGMRLPDDAPWEASAHSDGVPLAGLETRLTPVDGAEEGLGRLRVRGPQGCAAVWRRDTGQLRQTWKDDDGWIDTGDLVRPDGRGGVRVVQRVTEQVGAIFLVPVAEIEDRLATHPNVSAAAVVAYVDPVHGELPCAVVLPEGEPPDLASIRAHLSERGVVEAHLPTRLELVGSLPVDDLGGIHRQHLRAWLARTGTAARRARS
jgi:cyclohexanecarboxylate-CoA ligase